MDFLIHLAAMPTDLIKCHGERVTMVVIVEVCSGEFRPTNETHDMVRLNLLRQHYVPMDHSTASSDQHLTLCPSLRCLVLGKSHEEIHPIKF